MTTPFLERRLILERLPPPFAIIKQEAELFCRPSGPFGLKLPLLVPMRRRCADDQGCIHLFIGAAAISFKRYFLTALRGMSVDRVALATTRPLSVASTSVSPEKTGSATISKSFSSW